MKTMYIVKYSGGSYDDYYTDNIFVTDKKSTATKYVTRFNKMLKKWKLYYSQFEADDHGMSWIKDEHLEQHFNRWNCLREVNECSWDEIDCRKTKTNIDTP